MPAFVPSRFKKARLAAGYTTFHAAATAAKVDWRTISRIETGETTDLGALNFARIAKAYGHTMEHFIDYAKEPSAPRGKPTARKR